MKKTIIAVAIGVLGGQGIDYFAGRTIQKTGRGWVRVNGSDCQIYAGRELGGGPMFPMESGTVFAGYAVENLQTREIRFYSTQEAAARACKP